MANMLLMVFRTRLFFPSVQKITNSQKGITLDYEDGAEKPDEKLKNKKGIVEISYSTYVINKGVDARIFQR